MPETPSSGRASRGPQQVGEAAFLFADIVGFTSYTEAHGDARAAELAWRLRLGVERALCADAHVVKTLGDAVMVRVADAAEAASAGLRIVSEALPGDLDPPIRVGIAHGPAVECDGDFFGAAVNLAARVAAAAGPHEVLATGEVAAAAAGTPDLRARPRGKRRLRNITDPVRLHAICAGTPHDLSHGRRGAAKCRPAPAPVPTRVAGSISRAADVHA